ncbi:DUF2007 domain-containing protein [Thiohalobacter sp. IOR34]|uniref:putative signal transducing protein n=1 Tax=Thiohalobacter sp. IOR34 TaxID=3057176 RepID=UPI0025B1D03D|nr:DUF2007 domain-containing protein [Thiohalobacter sp. IOR34]WJW74989.1 DUF2007 domain-containing protein [Thiohalobacter sp. IOR34]
MKRLYSSADSLLLNHLLNLLRNAGIDCRLGNEFLGGGAGELPVLDVWPEIRVADADLAQARRLLEAALGPPPPAPPAWQCPHCGETLEGQFDQCWNCGKSRPGGLHLPHSGLSS